MRGNINIIIDGERVQRKVLENLDVQFVLDDDKKEIIKEAVNTTIWELFERKEDSLKDIMKRDKTLQDEYGWEFDK
jgi:hypothetical protein